MSPHVIEGTWEEIERHKAELIGHHLRVTVSPEKPLRKPSAPAQKSTVQPKELRAFGMLAGVLNTEDYLREKREDAIWEDRSL